MSGGGAKIPIVGASGGRAKYPDRRGRHKQKYIAVDAAAGGCDPHASAHLSHGVDGLGCGCTAGDRARSSFPRRSRTPPRPQIPSRRWSGATRHEMHSQRRGLHFAARWLPVVAANCGHRRLFRSLLFAHMGVSAPDHRLVSSSSAGRHQRQHTARPGKQDGSCLVKLWERGRRPAYLGSSREPLCARERSRLPARLSGSTGRQGGHERSRPGARILSLDLLSFSPCPRMIPSGSDGRPAAFARRAWPPTAV